MQLAVPATVVSENSIVGSLPVIGAVPLIAVTVHDVPVSLGAGVAAGPAGVTPELQAGMDFLKKNPPAPPRVFMYPEGNYRFFPVEHDWYLKYHLRDFWRGDNLLRLQLLVKRKIGAIVVKKQLIAPVDDRITNLGVYPDYFVPQIEADPRFRKVFENPAVAIYEFDASGIPRLD